MARIRRPPVSQLCGPILATQIQIGQREFDPMLAAAVIRSGSSRYISICYGISEITLALAEFGRYCRDR
jgi:hypothetical protein